MLSYHEHRQLREIEQWFEESDPQLTQMLRAHEAPDNSRQRRALRFAVDLTGGIMFAFGALAATATLMVFGILVLGAGACLHLAAHK